ncbi:O-methyltransferase [Flavobacterium chuncheonense]|uniref:O-methyltransferase n=1 Tax=Flavobacterium chuncheonense TaxID=2026653 RepID=A0ABW5YKG1_9FLAO
MVFQLQSYLKFILKSSNEHGIHSPFVFNLVTKCFYDKTVYPEYQLLKQYRQSLLKNKSSIEVTDFGAGSRVFTSNSRTIAAIAKNAGISTKNAELLFRIVRYFQPNSILEIGTSLGLATNSLALGNPKAKVNTLEGCPKTLNTAKQQFEQLKFENPNINFINTEFSKYLTENREITYDFVYFDGNHSKEATLEYFELLLPTINNDTLWIFDDIHWSPDMNEAWKQIQNHPAVTVSIDTFQWGMIIFRKEQNKEHFIINPEKNLSSFLFEKIKI